MTTHTSWILISFCAGSACLYGQQQGSIAGPSSGFVFDGSARVLREIRGIPGASILGEPVDFGFSLAAAYVAPRLDSALVVAADGTLHLFRLTGLTGSVPAERRLDGLASAARVVFSPAGTAAAVETAGRVQIVKGLPDAAVIAGTLSLPSVRSASALAASNRPRLSRAGSLAISDDGAYLLFVTGGAVQLIGTAGDGHKLMDAGPGALVAFAAGGRDAAIAWGGEGLVTFRDLTGASERRVLIGTAAPTGLAFSPDGRKLFVASASARSVAVYDLGSGDRTTVACDCKPGALAAMGNLFRLNEPGVEPLWLLDAEAAEPRTVFVPANVVSTAR
jgi:WD40 repeat protein